jgi:hypothetical protein
MANQEARAGRPLLRTVPAHRQERRMPTHQTRRRCGWAASGKRPTHLSRGKVSCPRTRDAVSTDPAGTHRASERAARRACRKAIPRPDSRRDSQEAARSFARPDFEMAALDYFRRLGHDNHRRLCRMYGWEEKKTKSPWGGLAVDYEAIARKAVQAMNPQDLQRFLVVCAPVSDLYCPGFNPRQSLAKDSNLAQTATRYKIDSAKLVAAVREQLSKKTRKSKRRERETQSGRLKRQSR